MKELILGYVADLVSNFLYYDRKGDEDLPLDAIQETIVNGEITIEEIVAKFKEELIKGIEEGL